jgi:RHS repeat-associated protein
VTVNGYDGTGLRVSKTVDGLTTFYGYEYNEAVLEVDAEGGQIAFNVRGLNLIARVSDGDTTYFMYNGHADVVALTDGGDTVLASYYYDAFGVHREQDGGDSNPYRYAGYMFDTETGLYYLKARFYDPELARFLQEDTYRGNMSDPLSLNLYAYVRYNPLTYWDPTGHAYINSDTHPNNPNMTTDSPSAGGYSASAGSTATTAAKTTTPSGYATKVDLPNGKTVTGYIENGHTTIPGYASVPIGAVVHTADGAYEMTKNGGVRVTVTPPAPSISTVQQTQKHEQLKMDAEDKAAGRYATPVPTPAVQVKSGFEKVLDAIGADLMAGVADFSYGIVWLVGTPVNAVNGVSQLVGGGKLIPTPIQDYYAEQSALYNINAYKANMEAGVPQWAGELIQMVPGLAVDIGTMGATAATYPATQTAILERTAAANAASSAAAMADDMAEWAAREAAGAWNNTDNLMNSAIMPGQGGVSPVGRAFQKHAGNSNRAGTFAGDVSGNALKNTEQGARYLDGILNSPSSSFTVRNTKAYGQVLDVRLPDGTGARWSADGKTFIGFLERYSH